MLRFLLIISLLVYLLYKLGLFRVSVRSHYRGKSYHNDYGRKSPDSGNVNIHSAPKDKKGSNFKGGEYVDYEEIN